MEKTKEHLTIPGQENTCPADDYTAFIELSNKCREFYRSRQQAAELAKKKLNISDDNESISGDVSSEDDKKKTSFELAMYRLRREMASLMDQDLSLMKQLLTLNEAIEDLKFRRNNYYSKSSMHGSSCEFSESDWSVSGTDLHDHGLESKRKYPNSPRISRHPRYGRQVGSANIAEWPEDNLHHTRLHNLRQTNSNMLTLPPSPLVAKRFIEPEIIIDDTEIRSGHGDQNSFDSGIDEPSHSGESTV